MSAFVALRTQLTTAGLVLLAACSGGTPLNPVDPDPLPGQPTGTPVLPFLIGSTGIDRANAVTVDFAGAIWVAGSFSGTVDFDPSPTVTVPRTALGPSDLFIAKYSVTGGLIRVVTFGGTGDDRVQALTVDASGSAWIGGAISNGYLCPGVSTTTTVNGASDLFVAKLDASGTCQWIVATGAAGADEVRALSVDSTLNVVVTGDVSGTVDFDAGTGTAFPVQPYGGGASDAFVASYSPTGAYRYAFTLGNGGDERGTAIRTDAAGATYVTTTFTGTIDADAGTGTLFLTTTGSSDILLAKYSAAGALVWADRIGGTDQDEATPAMVLQGADVVVGLTVRGLADLDPGTGVTTVQSLGGADGVIARYTVATGALTGTPLRISGAGEDAITRLEASNTGLLAVTGTYTGTIDADPTGGVRALQSSQNGTLTEGYEVVLGISGAPTWAATLGGGPLTTGTLLNESAGLAPAADGTFWSALTLYGVTDLDPSATSLVALTPLGSGTGDGAVAHYSAAGALLR